ncbi:MAG: Sensory histidine kinase QseC [uncultured Paraburkholderia sp.]|nr:MAG: Sensory histidine kinase QseC [uncultured Paraburkholderia sp.]
MRSIRRQLLVWLLALVLLGVGIAGWLIYRQALAEANELFDYQLEQIAAALPAEPFSQVLGSRDTGDEGIVLLPVLGARGVGDYRTRAASSAAGDERARHAASGSARPVAGSTPAARRCSRSCARSMDCCSGLPPRSTSRRRSSPTLSETGLPDVFYFPREDVNMARLERSTHSTHCPFKGDASYFHLRTEDGLIENAVWSYETPFEQAARIKGYLAFYSSRVDRIDQTS